MAAIAGLLPRAAIPLGGVPMTFLHLRLDRGLQTMGTWSVTPIADDRAALVAIGHLVLQRHLCVSLSGSAEGW